MVTWLDRRMNIACTIYTRIETGNDEYGNVIYAEVANPSTCFIQPVSQEEIQDGRAELGQYQVHLPASIVGILDGFSRVEIDGASYEAVEAPAIYPSLTSSAVHHVEIIVQRGSA